MKQVWRFLFGLFLILTVSFSNKQLKTVVIDAGHGGQDVGVSSKGSFEKNIVLAVAKKIKALNKNNNFKFILSRTNDSDLSLMDRINKINGLHPDFVISLHVDIANDSLKNGTELYISKQAHQFKKSQVLAEKIRNNLELKMEDVQIAGLYLLKNVSAPIVMIELGYLGNKSDREVLTTTKGQTKLATDLLNAIE